MSVELKPCPFCGGVVKMERKKRVFSPETNIYGNLWFASFMEQIECEPCFLRMGVACNAEYKTEQDALDDFEEFTAKIIDMWNRRAET